MLALLNCWRSTGRTKKKMPDFTYEGFSALSFFRFKRCLVGHCVGSPVTRVIARERSDRGNLTWKGIPREPKESQPERLLRPHLATTLRVGLRRYARNDQAAVSKYNHDSTSRGRCVGRDGRAGV